jgi:hypothetical protein
MTPIEMALALPEASRTAFLLLPEAVPVLLVRDARVAAMSVPRSHVHSQEHGKRDVSFFVPNLQPAL